MDKKTNFLDSKITYAVTAVIAAWNLMLYVSMRSILGFIGKAINFPYLTYILLIILVATLVINLVITLFKPNKGLLIYCLVINAIFLVFTQVYFFALLNYFRVFFVEMMKVIAVYIAVALIVFVIFYFPKTKFYSKTTAALLCAIMVLGVLFYATDLKNLQFNYFTNGAVVYAVGEDYQIVWTTHTQSTGSVEINGVEYTDSYAGGYRCNERVHKVSVPQEALDGAQKYTIKSKSVINEEGFSGLLGRTITKTYSFRPVDESDGIQYYAIADTHDCNKVAVKAASYYGDKLDFLIMAGDAVSLLATDVDLARILSLNYGITQGKVPVVFARGNHEVKDNSGEDLYKYVGTRGEDFFYTFRLGSVWGVVLDMGEDHEDGWIEFFGTADYDAYRNRQVEYLDRIISDADSEYNAEGVKLKLAISHINTAFMGESSSYFYDVGVAINSRLNTIGIDAMICGHIHQIFVCKDEYPAGEKLTAAEAYTGGQNYTRVALGADFPLISCGRRSLSQSLAVKETNFGTKYTGTALEYVNGNLIARFTDNKKNKVSTVSPFSGAAYDKDIVVF